MKRNSSHRRPARNSNLVKPLNTGDRARNFGPVNHAVGRATGRHLEVQRRPSRFPSKRSNFEVSGSSLLTKTVGTARDECFDHTRDLAVGPWVSEANETYFYRANLNLRPSLLAALDNVSWRTHACSTVTCAIGPCERFLDPMHVHFVVIECD